MSLRKTSAERMLNKAYNEALQNTRVNARFSRLVDGVIDNTHKTFKYILFTALLSKATDASINPLCLQAGSSLQGAYDARTIYKIYEQFHKHLQLNRCHLRWFRVQYLLIT